MITVAKLFPAGLTLVGLQALQADPLEEKPAVDCIVVTFVENQIVKPVWLSKSKVS